MNPSVHSSVIYNSQDLETAHVPISKRVDKTAVVYLHSGILAGCYKEENFPICDGMDGPGEHYAE